MFTQVIKVGLEYEDMGPANRLARQLSGLMNSNLVDDKRGNCIITITDQFGNSAELHFNAEGAMWFPNNTVDVERLKERFKIK